MCIQRSLRRYMKDFGFPTTAIYVSTFPVANPWSVSRYNDRLLLKSWIAPQNAILFGILLSNPFAYATTRAERDRKGGYKLKKWIFPPKWRHVDHSAQRRGRHEPFNSVTKRRLSARKNTVVLLKISPQIDAIFPPVLLMVTDRFFSACPNQTRPFAVFSVTVIWISAHIRRLCFDASGDP